jgi:hypothetical protein
MNDFSPYVLLEVHRAASQSPISLSSLALFTSADPMATYPLWVKLKNPIETEPCPIHP